MTPEKETMNQYRPVKTKANPLHWLVVEMLASMFDDIQFPHRTGFNRHSGEFKKRYHEAKYDLSDFKTWPVFRLAMATGLDIPCDETIRRAIAARDKSKQRIYREANRLAEFHDVRGDRTFNKQKAAM
jgi:hypothetical protein